MPKFFDPNGSLTLLEGFLLWTSYYLNSDIQNHFLEPPKNGENSRAKEGTMPTAICFIEKMRKQERIEDGSGKWKSGNWVVAQEKAESLIGKRIYFHEKQIDPSYSGGLITAVHVLPEDHPETPGRIVFTFIQDNEGIGYLAGTGGWRNEQKTIP